MSCGRAPAETGRRTSSPPPRYTPAAVGSTQCARLVLRHAMARPLWRPTRKRRQGRGRRTWPPAAASPAAEDLSSDGECRRWENVVYKLIQWDRHICSEECGYCRYDKRRLFGAPVDPAKLWNESGYRIRRRRQWRRRWREIVVSVILHDLEKAYAWAISRIFS